MTNALSTKKQRQLKKQQIQDPKVQDPEPQIGLFVIPLKLSAYDSY